MKYELGRCNLPELLKEIGWTPRDLQKRMGWTRQRTHDVISGRKKLGSALLFSVADTMGVNERRIYDLIPVETSGRE
ncbi:helix-turn-helix transcriptional regulator [Paenibacillus sp. Pae108]|uniref:helix-turn-helix domain-containing protein n=1 Tax=Paenibacillus sp. Pae108 TaxID=2926019 RepID=UPI0021175FD6|nr:helix-turn-helix transcriptional regulator [Paenibacillus sp. Pae108]